MADGIFINATGVGRIMVPIAVEPPSVRPADTVILSGEIGRHTMGFMAAGHGFDCETVIESDCSPLAASVLALADASVGLHCLRDLTRSGLASVLVEVAETAGVAIKVKEAGHPGRRRRWVRLRSARP